MKSYRNIISTLLIAAWFMLITCLFARFFETRCFRDAIWWLLSIPAGMVPISIISLMYSDDK